MLAKNVNDNAGYLTNSGVLTSIVGTPPGASSPYGELRQVQKTPQHSQRVFFGVAAQRLMMLTRRAKKMKPPYKKTRFI